MNSDSLSTQPWHEVAIILGHTPSSVGDATTQMPRNALFTYPHQRGHPL